jgi:hypothetical protein
MYMDLKTIIMGTEEAAILWGVSQDRVKRLCSQGRCEAILIGRTWVIARGQEKPPNKKKGDE